jgi:hypothetical protein
MTRGSTRKAKEAAEAAGQMRENDEGGVNALLSMTGNAASENDIISAMLSMSPSSNNKSALPSMRKFHFLYSFVGSCLPSSFPPE